MKPIVLFLFFALVPTFFMNAQVGIGTTNPNATLDIRSTSETTPSNTDGLLIPKIEEYPTTNPTATQDGMMVFATGSGTVAKGYYYWDNNTISWILIGGAKKINDLVDGKSDNDGTDNGSSVFLGIDAGAADDSSNNRNVGIGYQALSSNTTGYANTANGNQALSSNTTGYHNTANGYRALFSNTIGNINTATGSFALFSNTTGYNNTANGNQALYSNTTGFRNTANGYRALFSNATGYSNTANGYRALSSNTTGYSNTANGEQSLSSNTTGNYNVANGFRALSSNTTGSDNTANGHQSLSSNTTGYNNTANGKSTLQSNTTGVANVANGTFALLSNTTGSDNTANGKSTLLSNTTGVANVANGTFALFSNTTGYNNTANGYQALYSNTTGYFNTSIGTEALHQNTNGNYNIGIGNKAGYYAEGDRNVFLGNEAGEGTTSYNISRSIFLGNQAGRFETNSDRLYIENSGTTTPLVYGEFDNDLLRVNGDFEVEKTSNASITVKTPFSNKSSLKLFESGGSGDYGFEFEYDGSPDKLYLWSRTFAGNEGIRMTWLKNGRVGISTSSPNALLDIASTNPTAPKNTDGMLVPRISAFPTTNPGVNQNGMLVFLTTDNSFYYWDNNSTSWILVGGAKKINDLVDGKSDNDGTNDGSSVFLGIDAGAADDSSDNRNVGIGYQALYSNTTGYSNTANGEGALYSNTTGNNNTANGYRALYSNTTGYLNTANGYLALYSNTTGYLNIANGYVALYSNTTGSNNTANGYKALYSNTTGSNNTAYGYNAFYLGTSYSNSTAIGFNATISASNQVRLGNTSVSLIGGYANWTNASDKRIKTNIKEDIIGLDFIKKLRPVSYNLDMDAIARFEKTPDEFRLKDAEQLKAQEVQTGFIAQEVEAAAKEVNFNFHGVVKPRNNEGLYGLSYAEFVVPLVKAVQEQQTQIETQQAKNKKQQTQIQEQQTQIETQQTQIENLKKEIATIKALLFKKENRN